MFHQEVHVLFPVPPDKGREGSGDEIAQKKTSKALPL